MYKQDLADKGPLNGLPPGPSRRQLAGRVDGPAAVKVVAFRREAAGGRWS